MKPTKFELKFSVMAAPISEQLMSQGLKPSGMLAEAVDQCADQILNLYVHRLLTETEVKRARERLAKEMRPMPLREPTP